MKLIIASCLILIIPYICQGQAMGGNFKVLSIDSIDYYFIFNIQDSLGNEKILLSAKESDSKFSCKCALKILKKNIWYSLELYRQCYVLANKEEDIYIDLREMNYYDGEKYIVGTNRIPYHSPNLHGLSYCPPHYLESSEGKISNYK